MLFVCCVFCGWLLLSASSAPEKKLRGFAQFDSLIVETLNSFGLNRQQITHFKTTVDSTFQRKTFTVTVSKKFPETKLHLALKQTFYPYDVLVPARVLFPDKDLRIQFYFKNTVVRTLLINTELDKVFTEFHPLSNNRIAAIL